MAVSAVMFYNTIQPYHVGALYFDLILNERHQFNSTITNYAVEDGSKITDFLWNEPVSGNITALISNFSIYNNLLISNYAEDAFVLLDIIWRSRQLVTIATVHKIYENVAIKDISVNRDENTGEAINFTISFQEVKIVKLQNLILDVSITSSNALLQPTLNGGKVTGTVTSLEELP